MSDKQTITLADFDAAARSLKVPTQGLLFILVEIVRAQEARIGELEQALKSGLEKVLADGE